jgi:ketosteroid isomerase-like protein
VDEAAAERNEATIRRLYDALNRHDGETMAACYSADARFSDPVFPDLHSDQAGDMWRMLTDRATDLAVELPEAKADAQAGSARWIATYTFGATGRHVVNRVRSDFRFDSAGLIAEQHDDFHFWKWSRQAPAGLDAASALEGPIERGGRARPLPSRQASRALGLDI